MKFDIIDNIDYKVATYIRLSREDEDKQKYQESESIGNQRNLLMQYIKENKLTFVAEYIDDGVSGTSFDRPGFNKMIEDCEKGKINMIITKDLSRLGRNYIETGKYTEEYFPEHNIRFIAILDNIDTSQDSANNDIAPFKSILNEMYAKDTSRKINSVLKNKRNNGEYLGTPPFGYKKDPEIKNHLIIDEEPAEIVRLIFRKCLEGMGTKQIANYLSKEKIPIPSDYTNKTRGVKSLNYGLWQQSTVRFILDNEVYTGTVVQGKTKKLSFKSKKMVKVPKEDWIRIYNVHEAIISKEDFDRVQKILEGTKGSRNCEMDYLFKSLMKCSECGGYIGVKSPDKYGNMYGRCQRYASFSQFNVCTSHSFNYQVFEEQMLELLKIICEEYTNNKKLEEIAKASKKNKAKEIDIDLRIKKLNTEIENEARKLEIMYEDRLNGIISAEEYQKNAKNVKEKVTKLQNDVKDLELEKANGNIKKQDDKLDILVEEFLNMEKPTKEIIREFIEKIEIHDDKQVDIYFNFKPLQELNEKLNSFCVAKKEYERKVG